MKKVRENINEKFVEHTDPIKALGIGPLKVFVIRVSLKKEEWQISQGVDIIVARNIKDARMLWNKKLKSAHYWYGSQPVIDEIYEIKLDEVKAIHIEDANIE